MPLADLQKEELEEFKDAIDDTSEKRLERINLTPRRPQSIKVYSRIYRRNADIVAEALFRAAGDCEWCGKYAPFTRAKDNTPYLEVHHKVSLANGGEDTLDNVLALCPNCHRKMHHC